MKRLYRSKASIYNIVEIATSLGLEVRREAEYYIVSLPEGEQMFIYPSGDGGTFYNVFPSPWSKSLKTLQRIFAYAAKSEGKKIASSDVKDDVLSSGEERKKGTDEVSEFVSGTSDSVHGGDSASGEVPDGESGRGQDSSSSKSLALSQSEAGSKGGEESARSSDASGLSPDLSSKEEGESSASDCSKRKASEGEGSSGDGSCLKSLECASPSRAEEDALVDGQASTREGTGSQAPCQAPEDILRDILCEDGMPQEEDTRLDKESRESSTVPSPSGATDEGEASVPVREESPSMSFKVLKRIMDRGQLVSSVQSKYSFGGVCADLESLYGIPPRELINRARRVFARLVSEYGEGEEGPRWDYKKVSTRIASYQNWRVSDRKKESGRPAIAVLPDVSGSMAKFASQVLELSKALMALGISGAEVITIVQSNGYPLELWVNGKKLESFDYYQWDQSEKVLEWYKEVFRCWNVKVVVLAADWDGAWLYSLMAEDKDISRIYWLDVYLSSKVYPTLAKQFPPRWAQGMKWSITTTKKIRYVYGCRDAMDFIKGLELAMRRDK
jgi:hypothetical protein